MNEIIHYEMSVDERRRKLNSNASFGPACLCGNGNAHARKHFNPEAVTCVPCLEILAEKPRYLDNRSNITPNAVFSSKRGFI